jgi:hypothetical protein
LSSVPTIHKVLDEAERTAVDIEKRDTNVSSRAIQAIFAHPQLSLLRGSSYWRHFVRFKPKKKPASTRPTGFSRSSVSKHKRPKRVKSRNGYQIIASNGVFAGFARPENILILRLQSRRSLGDLTKGDVGAAAVNIGRPPWTVDPRSFPECANNGTVEAWSELSITPPI